MASIMLIPGIDTFMSECRALTNVIGNSVATSAVAGWEGAFDRDRARAVLNGEDVDELAMLDEDVEPLDAAELPQTPAQAAPVSEPALVRA